MTFFKHPGLPFAEPIRREIILAAQQKSNSCDLTLALLELINEETFYEDKIERLGNELSDVEAEHDREVEELEDKIKDLEEKVEKTEDKNYKLQRKIEKLEDQ